MAIYLITSSDGNMRELEADNFWRDDTSPVIWFCQYLEPKEEKRKYEIIAAFISPIAIVKLK